MIRKFATLKSACDLALSIGACKCCDPGSVRTEELDQVDRHHTRQHTRMRDATPHGESAPARASRRRRNR